MIVYNDVYCKIEISAAQYPGCYFVILDDDDECAVSCTSLVEAEQEAQVMRDEFLDDHGFPGVGT